VGEISDAAIAKVVEHAPRMTSPLSSFYFQHLGGAIARAGPTPPPSATAKRPSSSPS
jgi:hypothetical protein